MNATGEIIIPAEYDALDYTYNIISCPLDCVPCYKGDVCALVKTDGSNKLITNFNYEYIELYDMCGQFIARKKGTLAYCIINRNGQEIISSIIDSIERHGGQCVIYRSGEHYGLWHRGFGIVLPAIYDKRMTVMTGGLTVYSINTISDYLFLENLP